MSDAEYLLIYFGIAFVVAALASVFTTKNDYHSAFNAFVAGLSWPFLAIVAGFALGLGAMWLLAAPFWGIRKLADRMRRP